MSDVSKLQEQISRLIRRKGVAASKAAYYDRLQVEYNEKLFALQEKLQRLHNRNDRERGGE